MKFSSEEIETYSDLKEKIGYGLIKQHKFPLTHYDNINYIIEDCLQTAEYNLGCIVYLLERPISRKLIYDTDAIKPFMEELEIFLEYVKKGFFKDSKEKVLK